MGRTREHPELVGGRPTCRRTTALALALACVSACGGRTLDPYPEAVVTVHTDMPVPHLVGMLRVDLYDEKGWYSSREIATPNAADWPLSFSLVAREESSSKRVLMRLRAYPAGRVRDYVGERYEPIPDYKGPWLPKSLDELCSDKAEFQPPGTIELRRGDPVVVGGVPGPVTAPVEQGDCTSDVIDKIYAVTGKKVRIARAGKYRFEVMDTFPSMTVITQSDPKLFIRSDCRDQATQLACNDDIGSGVKGDFRSRIEVDLEPGTYTLFLGSTKADPVADVYIRGALVKDWEKPDQDVATGKPQLLIDGHNRTPSTEPQPDVTIDRLVEVDLEPRTVQKLSVVLHGDCVGTMARLGNETPYQKVALDEAATCVDTWNQLVSPKTTDDESAVPEPGSFAHVQSCDASASNGDVVCVPGGAFLLGDPRMTGQMPPGNSVPERVARIHRFWMDKYEVTVARYRKAYNAGLEHPGKNDLVRNDGKLPPSFQLYSQQMDYLYSPCTWSDKPLENSPLSENKEDYALTCISWKAARAFCRFAGGDLPTEAQWEYAATAAGRSTEAQYPWESDSPPDCTDQVYGRLASVEDVSSNLFNFFLELGPAVSGACIGDTQMQTPDFGPQPVLAMAKTDVTPERIVGMGGGVSEWVLDAAYPYDHACWRSQRLDDPGCQMKSAPARSVRGGSWIHGAAWLSGAARGYATTGSAAEDRGYIGFRCAYDAPPSSSTGGSP